MAGYPTVRFQPAIIDGLLPVYPVRGQRAGNRFRIVALSNSHVLNSNLGFPTRPDFESYPTENRSKDINATNLDLKSRDILLNMCINKLTNEDDNPKENIKLPSSISSTKSTAASSKLPYSPTAFRKLRKDT